MLRTTGQGEMAGLLACVPSPRRPQRVQGRRRRQGAARQDGQRLLRVIRIRIRSLAFQRLCAQRVRADLFQAEGQRPAAAVARPGMIKFNVQ